MFLVLIIAVKARTSQKCEWLWMQLLLFFYTLTHRFVVVWLNACGGGEQKNTIKQKQRLFLIVKSFFIIIIIVACAFATNYPCGMCKIVQYIPKCESDNKMKRLHHNIICVKYWDELTWRQRIRNGFYLVWKLEVVKINRTNGNECTLTNWTNTHSVR